MITELGLLDRDLAEHHASFGVPTKDNQYGVAYPAIFVVDESGRLVDKRIRENYRAREGALKVLEEALGLTLPASGRGKSTSASHVTVSAVTDSDRYVRWQETRLHLVLDVQAGWHVYGRPIPDGYTPVTVEIATVPEVSFGSPEYPPSRAFRVEGLDEEFQVYDGRFDIRVPIAVNVPPDFGGIDVVISVRYQACSQSECLPPQALKLRLHSDEAPP